MHSLTTTVASRAGKMWGNKGKEKERANGQGLVEKQGYSIVVVECRPHSDDRFPHGSVSY